MKKPAPEIARALYLSRLGRFDEATQLLRTAVERNPRDITACLLLVDLEDRLGNIEAAAQLVDDLLVRSGENPKLLFRRGLLAMRADHQQLSMAKLAETYFRRAARADPLMAEAHLHHGLAMRIGTRHAEAAPMFRRACVIDPTQGRPFRELAQALHQSDDFKGAERCLTFAITSDPSDRVGRQDLHDLKRLNRSAHRRPILARFPHQISMLAETRVALDQFVLSDNFPTILGADVKVVTFGSCFAGNVARALREAGVNAQNTTMGEFVNSTTANRHYIDWVVNGVEGDIVTSIVEYHSDLPDFSSDVEVHRRTLAECDVVVFTVGVAPGFFHRETNNLVFPRSSSFSLRAMLKECEFRTTTVDENVSNIEFIIDQVRKINKNCSIVVTVSPVPLTVSLEYKSPIIADCVSKSTLRVAVDVVMRRGIERLVYWPSFEIVRWLGAYVPGMYGDEDGSTLHVSERVIDLIVSTFIDKLSGGMLTPVSRPQ